MKYSVIIPALNEEKLLGILLTQLLEFRSSAEIDLEIIVSDGGSRDKTIEIAMSGADKVIAPSEDKIECIARG